METRFVDPFLQKELSADGVDEQIDRATLHAEYRIREYKWGNFRPTSSIEASDLTVAGLAAADFVHLALQRFIDGTRKYDADRSLLENLKSAADSIIWSAKKSRDLDPTIDYRLQFNESGVATDPISASEDESPSPSDEIRDGEVIRDQQGHFTNLYNSFDGNSDVQEYLESLSEGIYKPNDISEVTGIDIDRIYEIRRMLKKNAPQFFGVPNFKEMERKIREGT